MGTDGRNNSGWTSCFLCCYVAADSNLVHHLTELRGKNSRLLFVPLDIVHIDRAGARKIDFVF